MSDDVKPPSKPCRNCKEFFVYEGAKFCLNCGCCSPSDYTIDAQLAQLNGFITKEYFHETIPHFIIHRAWPYICPILYICMVAFSFKCFSVVAAWLNSDALYFLFLPLLCLVGIPFYINWIGKSLREDFEAAHEEKESLRIEHIQNERAEKRKPLLAVQEINFIVREKAAKSEISRLQNDLVEYTRDHEAAPPSSKDSAQVRAHIAAIASQKIAFENFKLLKIRQTRLDNRNDLYRYDHNDLRLSMNDVQRRSHAERLLTLQSGYARLIREYVALPASLPLVPKTAPDYDYPSDYQHRCDQATQEMQGNNRRAREAILEIAKSDIKNYFAQTVKYLDTRSYLELTHAECKTQIGQIETALKWFKDRIVILQSSERVFEGQDILWSDINTSEVVEWLKTVPALYEDASASLYRQAIKKKRDGLSAEVSTIDTSRIDAQYEALAQRIRKSLDALEAAKEEVPDSDKTKSEINNLIAQGGAYGEVRKVQDGVWDNYRANENEPQIQTNGRKA